MGRSLGDFVKYPRTPHLFGSKVTDDDKHLNDADSRRFLADESLIVEEKLDGTNVGLHFDSNGQMILQCRGHLITEGMHPQYDLFKQWTATKQEMLRELLSQRYILFGEWVYAKHSIYYQKLSHYFFEFDMYDKMESCFLDLAARLAKLTGTGLATVPVVHQGSLSRTQLEKLIGPSSFESLFENPCTNQQDALMEGLYLRTERDGKVTGRAKWVRPEFVEKIKQSQHWQHQQMVVNRLADGVDIWS